MEVCGEKHSKLHPGLLSVKVDGPQLTDQLEHRVVDLDVDGQHFAGRVGHIGGPAAEEVAG